LPDGKVLVAGGVTTNWLYNGSYLTWVGLASAELYDPATGNWSYTGSLSIERASHTATLLPNGRVLVAAGASTNSAELYEPTPSYLTPITNPVSLADGSFQFSFSNPGGSSFHILASPNLTAPVNTWSNLGLATETPPGSGQFQFTDHQAMNYPKRFYRVSSP